MCLVVVGTSTPLNRLFLEKLTVAQLFKEFPVFYGARRIKNCVWKGIHPNTALSQMKSSLHAFLTFHICYMNCFFLLDLTKRKVQPFLLSRFLIGWKSRT
jgi:hypothetical protein